ncbi:MAG: hypothetical protein JWR44_1576 [Hymenobacter sp.]|jgi:hypothetical protein|nr:hypothetical protein [Hymenobacter sp.]
MFKLPTNALKIAALLVLPFASLAQDQKPELPYNTKLIRQQPEVGSGEPTFKPSSEIRGMKSLTDGTVYMVSTDNQSLSAYQGSRLVWRTNVVNSCPTIMGQRTIQKVTLSSKTIFVRVGDRTFAEVNAATGKITVSDVQKG